CRWTKSAAKTPKIGLASSAVSVSPVASTVKACRSRNVRRPATWSTSAPVRMTAAIGLLRRSARGCSAGVASSWARRSGVALRRIHCSPSPERARLAWVRGLTRVSPLQARRHTGHRQFHCGKPPPPAEPSTIAVKRPIQRENKRTKVADLELGREVAVDLEADADFYEGRRCPGHDRSFRPLFGFLSTLSEGASDRARTTSARLKIMRKATFRQGPFCKIFHLRSDGGGGLRPMTLGWLFTHGDPRFDGAAF